MISGRQIREARALLGWSMEQLEKRAGVAKTVLDRAESVNGTPSMTLHQAACVQQAFQRAGLKFGLDLGVLKAISIVAAAPATKQDKEPHEPDQAS